VIPDFSLTDCDPIQADAVNRVVTWKGRSDVSALAGQPVRLQFELPSSKLYAFQFGRESNPGQVPEEVDA